MADSKLADLSATTAVTTDDLLYVVDDPAGTPADKKITAGNLATSMATLHGGMVLIGSSTLGSDTAAITFSSIPATYKDLLLVGNTRTDRAANALDRVAVQVGTGGSIDTNTANYDSTFRDEGNTAATGRDSATGYVRAGYSPGASGTAGYFLPFEVKILNYATTGQVRGIITTGGGPMDGTDHRFSTSCGFWENTAGAIDIVRIIPITGTNLVTGSNARLYGLL